MERSWIRALCRIALALQLALVTAGSAQASIVTFTSQSAWQTGLAPATLVDFDGLPVGPLAPNAVSGLTFNAFNGGAPTVAAESGPHSIPNVLSVDDPLLGAGAGGGVEIGFAAPQAGAGFWYKDAQFAGSLVSAYDSANTLLTSFELVFPKPTEWQFVGFASSSPEIVRITVAIVANDRVTLDDVLYAQVPEPGTCILLLGGLTAIGFGTPRTRVTSGSSD